jgi:predicted PurR-regulated permease PerM
MYIVVRSLGDWLRAVAVEAVIVGLLWLVGLELLHVPGAPLWALLGGLFQFVPVVGGMLSLAGPAIAMVLAHPAEKLVHLGMVLGVYAVIVLLDGLVVEPYLLHRATLVPWWAALAGPVVLGLLIPPWGVLIAPPLLGVVFGFVGTGDTPRV